MYQKGYLDFLWIVVANDWSLVNHLQTEIFSAQSD
eukprot:SAG31_NODE_36808_length_310_cov_0.720379_1_plen_34_part_01